MNYGKWINLSLDTRRKIAEIFGIEQKGQIEVFSNVVKSDGYVVHDIEAALTVKAMQDYLKTKEEDPNLLSTMLVTKIESMGQEVKPVVEPDKVIATGTIEKIEVMSEVKPKVKKVVKKVKVIKKVVKKNAKK